MCNYVKSVSKRHDDKLIQAPKVSVIMSAYNTPYDYLKSAINSILQQSFRDFEFLIIDDASENLKVAQIIESYDDKRIIFIKNEINKGLTANLNVLIERSRGKYIARMDSDDVAFSKRLEKQYMFLEQHENIHVIGSFVKANRGIHMFGGNMDYEMRKVKMLFYNAGICHPSAMIRKEFLNNHKIRYDESIKKAQDYALWIECLKWSNMVSFPTPLMYYREHDGQISQANREGTGGQKQYARIIRKRLLEQLSVNLDSEEEEIFYKVGEDDYEFSTSKYFTICNKIIDANSEKKLYINNKLKNELCLYGIKILLKKKKIKLINKLISSNLLRPQFIFDICKRALLTNRLYNRYLFKTI